LSGSSNSDFKSNGKTSGRVWLNRPTIEASFVSYVLDISSFAIIVMTIMANMSVNLVAFGGQSRAGAEYSPSHESPTLV
jgi:hypothetical protein